MKSEVTLHFPKCIKLEKSALESFEEWSEIEEEAFTRRCSVKKVFLKILQNSQENTCASVSILIKWQDWGSRNGLWHECFPVNFAKFSRAPFLQNKSRWLVLSVPDIPYFSLLLFLSEKFLYFTELKIAFLWNSSKYTSGHSLTIKWHFAELL